MVNIHNILILAALASIVTVAHLVGSAMATIDARVGINKVRLFYGPRIASLVIFGVSLELGCIPTGGYIELADRVFEPGNNTLPAIRRIAIRVNGCIVTFVLAAISMGVLKSCNSVATGFGQVAVGAIAPRSEGQWLLRGLLASMSGGHLAYSLGLIAAKLTSLNLMSAICQVAVDQVGCSPRYRRHVFAGNMAITIGTAILFAGWFIAALFLLQS